MVNYRTDKAYYIATSTCNLRRGEAAEILNVITFIPEDATMAHPCFHLRYLDGTEEYLPLLPVEDYKIVVPQELGLFKKEK